MWSRVRLKGLLIKDWLLASNEPLYTKATDYIICLKMWIRGFLAIDRQLKQLNVVTSRIQIGKISVRQKDSSILSHCETLPDACRWSQKTDNIFDGFGSCNRFREILARRNKSIYCLGALWSLRDPTFGFDGGATLPLRQMFLSRLSEYLCAAIKLDNKKLFCLLLAMSHVCFIKLGKI